MGEIKESKKNYVIKFPEILAEILREKTRQEIIEETGRFVVLMSAAEENKEYIESLKKKGGKRDEFISREI